MLIRFHVENYLSIRDEIEFSLIPGRTYQHSDHKIPANSKSDFDLLKLAAIFGANASGKSNFIKAIAFARDYIVHTHSPKSSTGVGPFRLDSVCRNKPSRFRFEIKLNEKSYDYGFSITRNEIVEEWLYEIRRSSEKMLFNRSGSNIKLGKIDYSLDQTDLPTSQKKQRLDYIGKDTRENELFLATAFERKQVYFKELYKWFSDSLIIIRPDSKSVDTEWQIVESKNFLENFSKILRYLDTGIDEIKPFEIDVEKEIFKVYPETEDVLRNAIEHIEDNARLFIPMPDGKRFAIRKKPDSGEIEGYKLMTKHNQEYFEISWESHGTQRLMDLIPIFLKMRDSGVTVFIDEINRSLHPKIAFEIVKIFLKHKNLNNSQLVFTSHEDLLLDFELLRRDEIWFVEKSDSGVTKFYSLEEFKPRYDTDIRKGYLNGRFGSIPRIMEKQILDTLETA